MVREKDSDDVLDMGDTDAERLRSDIGAALEPYGIEVVKVVVTHVLPPMEFVASRESRRLATLQRQEEEARHALAILQQSDREALDRQRIEARQRAIELEAANEVARLERLESRIRDYPKAMQWDVDSRRLDVAAALAANTRAMVQVGPTADVAASLLMHTLPDDGTTTPAAEQSTAPTDRRPRSSQPKR
jgi:regulator of protease activity HflC (stomatin/prohibitin superfamily)